MYKYSECYFPVFFPKCLVPSRPALFAIFKVVGVTLHGPSAPLPHCPTRGQISLKSTHDGLPLGKEARYVDWLNRTKKWRVKEILRVVVVVMKRLTARSNSSQLTQLNLTIAKW